MEKERPAEPQLSAGVTYDVNIVNVVAHKFDKSKMGWPIMGDFKRAMFYDKEQTMKKNKTWKQSILNKPEAD